MLHGLHFGAIAVRFAPEACSRVAVVNPASASVPARASLGGAVAIRRSSGERPKRTSGERRRSGRRLRVDRHRSAVGFAGVAVRPWVTIWAGPHVRARETAGQTERWVLWEARLDFSGDRVARRVGWSLETWGVAAAGAGAPQPFGRGLGTAGAVSLRLQRTIRAELSYRVEQIRLAQGSRRETTEVLSLWLSWGRR